MTVYAFTDAETTGLDHEHHEVWELAVILQGHPRPWLNGEWCWQLPVDVARLHPQAAHVNHFHTRYLKPPSGMAAITASPADTGPLRAGEHVAGTFLAEQLAVMFDSAQWIGVVPDFAVKFMAPWLRGRGQLADWPATPWHYQSVDMETAAGGKLGLAPPWDSDELFRLLGVDSPPEARHTALGDARTVRDLFHAVWPTREDVDGPGPAG